MGRLPLTANERLLLTKRQQVMLDILLENGANCGEIAERMGVRPTTVKKMMFVVREKLGYGTVLELAVNQLHKRYVGAWQ